MKMRKNILNLLGTLLVRNPNLGNKCGDCCDLSSFYNMKWFLQTVWTLTKSMKRCKQQGTVENV